MSMPPRRPSQPFSLTRTSYQVGRPWMLLGKMLRGLTGTPMRRMAFANSSLAEADPEPLTFANLTTKSLTASMLLMLTGAPYALRAVPPRGNSPSAEPAGSCSNSDCLALRIAALRPRLRRLQQELLHVPGPGRTAFGAQTAVQAHVLVLHHHTLRLQRPADVQRLCLVLRRRLQPRAQV